jgi:DNA-binding NtrC family response regulator
VADPLPRPHATRLRSGQTDTAGGPAFCSAAYLKCLAQVRRFARDGQAAILIEGESGTGKTQLARQIHLNSPRTSGPYHNIVLSTLDDTLAGSELFGHVLGAFTDARHARTGHFATANGGTLFLDEIGKASMAVQQKLLHAIEYGEIRPIGSDRDIRVDVRIVAATNVSLESLVAQDRFLADLHARLSAFRICLPPLRERRADIPPLVTYYIDLFAPRCGYEELPVVDDELLAALQRAPWPNNLRQLSATVHRLLVDAEGAAVLTLDHCLDDLSYLNDGVQGRRPQLTRHGIDQAVTRAGSIVGAARLLGVDRTTIYRFLRHRPSEGGRDVASSVEEVLRVG